MPTHIRGTFCEPITEKIIEMVRDGVPFKFACQGAGTHESSGTRWRQRGERALQVESDTGTMPPGEYPYAKFTLDLAAARAEAVSRRIKQIDAAGETQWQASAWWLERQLPQEFGRTDRHELTGASGGPIQIGQAEIVAQAQAIVAEHMKELSSGE